jgi:putative tryptophan/tyrosine transport system substrate-binding protein
VEVSSINMRDASEIERGVAAFARSPKGGLILTASALAIVHRTLIIALAARHKLPAIYYRRYSPPAVAWSPMGSDVVQQYRGADSYVDRILKGEKPADMPGTSADQVRIGDQSKNGKGARPRNSRFTSRPRRRGD